MSSTGPYRWKTRLESTYISVPDGHERAVITGPGLHALDLVDSPDVRVVDLSACSGGLHLAVRDCPNLEQVVVSDEGTGAIVHVDFGERPPGLEIAGPVEDIDACWIDPATGKLAHVQTPNGRLKRGPLNGGWVGPVCDQGHNAELAMFTSSLDSDDPLVLEVGPRGGSTGPGFGERAAHEAQVPQDGAVGSPMFESGADFGGPAHGPRPNRDLSSV